MKKSLFLFALITVLLGCDRTGTKAPEPWEIPTHEVEVPQTPDTTQTIDLEEPAVAVVSNILTIDLAAIKGAGNPTQVTMVADLHDGVVTGYTVTTKSSPAKAPQAAAPTPSKCIPCYSIQKGDTKTSLAKHFNIPITSIKNKTLRVGDKLQIE